MRLATGVLAYRLIKSVGISEDKIQLVRTTLPSLTYDCMKKQMKVIYNEISQGKSSASVKVEPMIETGGYNGTKKIDG